MSTELCINVVFPWIKRNINVVIGTLKLQFLLSKKFIHLTIIIFKTKKKSTKKEEKRVTKKNSFYLTKN